MKWIAIAGLVVGVVVVGFVALCAVAFKLSGEDGSKMSHR